MFWSCPLGKKDKGSPTVTVTFLVKVSVWFTIDWTKVPAGTPWPIIIEPIFIEPTTLVTVITADAFITETTAEPSFKLKSDLGVIATL